MSPKPLRFFLLALLLPLAARGEGCDHVIFVSCDGMRPDAILQLGEEKLPNLHRLKSEGAWTGNARTDYDYSVTLPNHTCMITGRPVKGDVGHNWTENGTPKLGQMLHRHKKAYVRGMFGVAHDHGLRTALFASKEKFKLYDHSYNERTGKIDEVGEDDGQDKIDAFEFEKDTSVLVDKFIAAHQENPFHLAMLHLRNPDTAGHAHGWDLTEGSPYLQSLKEVDGLIGRVLEVIDSDERLQGKTAVIVTADHGGRLETKTHTKADHVLNYTIPFFVWGPGVQAGGDLYAMNPESRTDPDEDRPDYAEGAPVPVRNGDVGNLVTMLLGLPAIDGSTINGKQDLQVAVLGGEAADGEAPDEE